MTWTWDPEKNRENIRKHGFDFQDAVDVFDDQSNYTREDDYQYEERWQTFGTVGGRFVVVIHTWPNREGEQGRIISARKLEPYERRLYQEGYGQTNG